MSDYMIEFPEDDVIEVLFNDVIVTGSEPPSGTISITENGDYDVTNYAEASVNVPQGITPTGTISIIENGTVDVTTYAEASVNVPQGVFPSGTLSITDNGTFDVTNYVNASVNVPKIPNNCEIINLTVNEDSRSLSFNYTQNADPHIVFLNITWDTYIQNSITAFYAQWLLGRDTILLIGTRSTAAAPYETNVTNSYMTVEKDTVNKTITISIIEGQITSTYFKAGYNYQAVIYY